MAILIDDKTKVLVQGITGHQGTFHTELMVKYGTRVVAGTSPGKGGQEVSGVPVYNTVDQAVQSHGPNASVLFIPAPFVKDAAFEAIAAGVELVVIITEGVPLHDAMEVMAFAEQGGVRVVGPNTFGVITPGRCKIGIMPGHAFARGHIGLVSRSGTLSYEIAESLSSAGLGISTAIGMGGDRVVGLNFVDVLKGFEHDEETQAAVLVGEIGGVAEEEAAEFIKTMQTPVAAYLAGRSAPPGRRMGHAGAIVQGDRGNYASKKRALEEGGALVADLPWEVSGLVRKMTGAE
ncbi:MAG: succinate--CoA ligase subunit alpha [Bacillota bacterium]